MARLSQYDPTAASALLENIMQKAEGVFLWVFLVVRSLLMDLADYDSIADLRSRLEIIPVDLENLYSHMLRSIDPAYVAWGSRALLLCRRADQFEGSRIGRALESRCGGLLELATSGGAVMPLTKDGNLQVKYTHRTVADFLDTRYIRYISDTLSQRAGSDFNPDRALLECYVLRLRRGFHTPVQRVSESHSEYPLWYGKPPHNDCLNFLAFATVHGLARYLSVKLKDPYGDVEYLYLALCHPWKRTSPHEGIVALLLQRGFDPNRRLGRSTVWQNYLSVIIASQEVTRTDADIRHLKIIEMLLRHSADPMETY
ncbi:hypothetical protein BKA64DRAFT_636028 [Cadophora sp. MPI-SDFR-AT-0126]|nr:hypothetical protein BKA64DRAFT_636028 [Leotiomycetes sp. MPI-SDFR-AT-0126]